MMRIGAVLIQIYYRCFTNNCHAKLKNDFFNFDLKLSWFNIFYLKNKIDFDKYQTQSDKNCSN